MHVDVRILPVDMYVEHWKVGYIFRIKLADNWKHERAFQILKEEH